MMLDIAALQEMYGADYTTNSGDTVYKWNPNQGITYVNGVAAITPAANRIFATIWDGGGIDTYDLSAYTTALKIDLRAGDIRSFPRASWPTWEEVRIMVMPAAIFSTPFFITTILRP